MTSSRSLAQPLRDRAGTLAHRLLAGGGVAAVVAYRLDPEKATEVLAHGVTSDGALVVALTPGPLLDAGCAHEVRMDVRREATEAAVRITSASIHLLGRLSWLTSQEVRDLGDEARLPDPVTLLLGSPAVRWARVTTERVVLHDASGVTPFTWDEAVVDRATFPAPSDELNAHDVVLAAAGTDLEAVCRAVVDGRLPGRVQSDRPSANVCNHTADRVFCVDVDGLGVNLMHVGRERTTVVFAPFDAKVGDLDALAMAVATLAARARAS